MLLYKRLTEKNKQFNNFDRKKFNTTELELFFWINDTICSSLK